MFGALRSFIGIFLFLVAGLLIVKFIKPQRRMKYYITAFVATVLFITALGFLPFENLVYSFKSPESVYHYYLFSEEDAELVIEGEECALVVGRKNNTSTLVFVPKAEDGWKIGVANAKIVHENFSSEAIINVYRCKKTNDYFVTAFAPMGGALTISDVYNSVFYSLEKSSLGKTFVTYYAHISDFNLQYSITVNGEPISMYLGKENTEDDGSLR